MQCGHLGCASACGCGGLTKGGAGGSGVGGGPKDPLETGFFSNSNENIALRLLTLWRLDWNVFDAVQCAIGSLHAGRGHPPRAGPAPAVPPLCAVVARR